MQWGNDVLQWLASDEGWRVLSGAIIPAVAIIVAGVIAALISRASIRRLISLHQRDALTAAVGGFVLAGRKASRWNELSAADQVQVDNLIAEAETRIRLLPATGSGLAANWATHQLDEMKRDSAGFRFQAQQTLAEYRDRLIGWSERPRRAKKLFGADLERWRFEAAAIVEPALDISPAGRFGEPAAAGSFAAPGAPSPSRSSDAPREPTAPRVAAWQGAPPPSPGSAVSPGQAAPTESTPLVITSPRSASSVRERVLPAEGD